MGRLWLEAWSPTFHYYGGIYNVGMPTPTAATASNGDICGAFPCSCWPIGRNLARDTIGRYAVGRVEAR